MPIAETIETPRLTLRLPTHGDADDIYAYGSDSEFRRFLSLPDPYLKEHAIGLIENILERDREEQPTWAVCMGAHVIGVVNMRFLAEHRIAEIGYGLSRSFWGQGITVEAMRAIIDAAFECYPQLVRVRARANAENHGSRRVMEKLGLRLEGLLRQDSVESGALRDEVVYGLLRHEWRG